MTSYVSTSTDVTEPRFGHVWRAKDGTVNATVRLGLTHIAFEDAALARAAAAACIQAAEAIEAFPAEPEPLPSAGHCPICGGKLDANGRHVTRSGASIPAPDGAQ